MLSFWRVAILATLWLIFECVFSWFATCQPSSYQHDYYEAASNYCSSFQGPLVSIVNWLLIWLGHLVKDEHDAVTALGTIVIALFTFTLWWSTSKLWKAGERHSERELRAYVCISRGMVKNFEPDRIPEVVIWVINSGKTPAYDLQSWIAIEGDDIPRKKPFKSDWEFVSHRTVIGPGGSLTLFVDAKLPISQDSITKIKAKKRAIWGYGEIRYRDAFDNTQRTKYRLIYNGNDRGAMTVDAEGNEAT